VKSPQYPDCGQLSPSIYLFRLVAASAAMGYGQSLLCNIGWAKAPASDIVLSQEKLAEHDFYTFWKEQRLVESYDVDICGRLRPYVLFSYLQLVG
jgi:hypothetical protein